MFRFKFNYSDGGARVLLVWGAVFGLFLVVAGAVLAQPNSDGSFESLKKRYFSLRNADADLQHPEEWENLADGLTEYYGRNRRKASEVELLFVQYARAVIGAQLNTVLPQKYPHTEVREQLEEFIRRSAGTGSELTFEAEVRLLELEQARFSPSEFSQHVAQVKQRYANDGRVSRLERFLTVPPLRKRQKLAPLVKGRKLVVIDAGHGGEDEGATGPLSLREKEETLEFARALSRLLEEDPRLETRLVRSVDEFIPLIERVRFANDFEADLFLSLHFNASPKGNNRGFQAYYLDDSGGTASETLVEREGGVLAVGQGYVPRRDLMFMLSDYIQRAKIERSSRLASLLAREFEPFVSSYGLENGGVRTAPFYVLMGAHMPCVLLELLHIDNQEDAQLLRKKSFREDALKAMVNAVHAYFWNAPKKKRK